MVFKYDRYSMHQLYNLIQLPYDRRALRGARMNELVTAIAKALVG